MAEKTVRLIRIDADRCTGCRACEVICSASHARPKYSAANTSRSRIRVLRRELDDVFLPVLAGGHTDAECLGRNLYLSNGREQGECAFCGVSCPSRDLFKEPDSGLPLQCDMCEGEDGPLCVRWCLVGALAYEERTEAGEEDARSPAELDNGLAFLVHRHGLERVAEALVRMAEAEAGGSVKVT